MDHVQEQRASQHAVIHTPTCATCQTVPIALLTAVDVELEDHKQYQLWEAEPMIAAAAPVDKKETWEKSEDQDLSKNQLETTTMTLWEKEELYVKNQSTEHHQLEDLFQFGNNMFQLMTDMVPDKNMLSKPKMSLKVEETQLKWEDHLSKMDHHPNREDQHSEQVEKLWESETSTEKAAFDIKVINQH